MPSSGLRGSQVHLSPRCCRVCSRTRPRCELSIHGSVAAQNLLILASERERVRSDVQELFSSNPETSKHKWVREWIANLQEMDQHSQYSSSDCNAAQLPDAEGTDVGQERTTALEKHRDIVMTSVHSDMHPPSLHKLPDRRVMDDVCDEVQLREEQQLRALAQPIRKSQQRELFIIFGAAHFALCSLSVKGCHFADAAQRSVEARRRYSSPQGQRRQHFCFGSCMEKKTGVCKSHSPFFTRTNRDHKHICNQAWQV